MNKSIKQYCTEIIDYQGEATALISFSTGKDSLSMFLRLWETGIFEKFILFYFYYIPDLSWVLEYIDYFTKKYPVEIIQLPNPALYKMLAGYSLQTPGRVEGIKSLMESDDFLEHFDFQDLSYIVKKYRGLSDNVMTALGVTMYDSPLRHTIMQKTGAINYNTKRWYPIIDFKLQDIKAIIKKHDVKLPDDYAMFGRSFDGFDYRFMKPLKDQKPEDYKKVKEFFPLVDLMIARHEHYIKTPIRHGRLYGGIK